MGRGDACREDSRLARRACGVRRARSLVEPRRPFLFPGSAQAWWVASRRCVP